VPVNGNFYVGWRQVSETFLNAGFDLNTLNNGKQFYWLNGNWNQSQAKGSLMIRPMTGSPARTTSVQDIVAKNSTLKIWPNPVRDHINVDPGELIQNTSQPTIRIIDIRGSEVMKISYSEQFDVSSLPDGIYFIILNINGKLIKQNRFVKIN